MSEQLSVFRMAFLFVLIMALALAIVGEGARLVKLGYLVRHMEQQKQLLAEGNRKLLCEISALGSPDRIAREVGERRLGLVEPSAAYRASNRGSR